jgi:hypothetical protein
MAGFPMHRGNAKSIWIRARRPDHKRLISAPESAQYQLGKFAAFVWLAGQTRAPFGKPKPHGLQGNRRTGKSRVPDLALARWPIFAPPLTTVTHSIRNGDDYVTCDN